MMQADSIDGYDAEEKAAQVAQRYKNSWSVYRAD